MEIFRYFVRAARKWARMGLIASFKKKPAPMRDIAP
jgi:hypothetical protein